MQLGKRLYVSMILLGAFLAGVQRAEAQSDQATSVADAARQAREQKKAAAAKQGQVITNDTLEPEKATAPAAATGASAGTNATPAPTEGAASTTEKAAGESPAATGDAKAAATSEGKTEASSEKDEHAKIDLEALKQQIREMKKQADLVQRELNLASDSFYSQTDFSKDVDGKAKLDELTSELGIKKEELDQLMAKLPAGETVDEPKPAEALPQQ